MPLRRLAPFALPALTAVPALLAPTAAHAQTAATVREIVQVVKTAPPGDAPLVTAKINTPVNVGGRVRTGGRSAAGLRFQDRSLLRIGELSEVVVTSGTGRSVQVNRGQVFADYKSPGTISGGYAVAAVRGTHIQYFVDSTKKQALVRCYKGRVFVGAADNPVYSATTSQVPPGSLTESGLIGATVDWTGGEVRFTDGPFQGQTRSITAFNKETGTVTFQPDLPQTLIGGPSGFLLVKVPGRKVVELRENQGTTVREGQDPSDPYSVVHEEYAMGVRFPYFQNMRDGRIRYVYPGTEQHMIDRVNDFPIRRAIDRATQTEQSEALLCDPSELPLLHDDLGEEGHRHFGARSLRRSLSSLLNNAPTAGSRLASVPAGGTRLAAAQTAGGGGRTSDTGGGLPTPEQIFLPQQVIPPVVNNRSQSATFRFEPYGLATTEDNTIGARLRFQGIQGDVYTELGYLYGLEDGKSRHNLSEGFMQIKTHNGTLTGGRQHLFLRLSNNQDIGTLLGLDTTDAVVYETPRRGGFRAQGGYIFDSQALDDGGAQGVFTRGQLEFGRGLVGYSILGNVRQGNQVGWSVDTAQALIPNVLDVYAEGGEDSGGRRLLTGGLYVPAFYHLTRVDMFLEYAHRQDVEDRFSIRFRKELGRSLLAVAFADHRSKEGWVAGGGIMWSKSFR